VLNATEEDLIGFDKFEKQKEKEYEEFKKSKEYHEMESEAN
jgi:hypothetical protein